MTPSYQETGVSDHSLPALPGASELVAADTGSHRGCPRRYLTLSGAVLGLFLVFHLGVNFLALWPERFQQAVNAIHRLGPALPVLEAALVFIPLSVHLWFGFQVLWQDKLKYNPQKRRGSPLRQCLQQATALILLGFLAVHLVTLHPWFGGHFEPAQACLSAARAVWKPVGGLALARGWNLVVALLYPVGLAAALYHWANGISTGADIFGCTPRPAQERRLWTICLMAMVLLLAAGLAAWKAEAPL